MHPNDTNIKIDFAATSDADHELAITTDAANLPEPYISKTPTEILPDDTSDVAFVVVDPSTLPQRQSTVAPRSTA